jgi:hypothetical protein
VVVIEDDAGGFDQHPLHQGRALDQLAGELPDAISVERVDGGTRVTSRVPIGSFVDRPFTRRSTHTSATSPANDRGTR